MPRGKKKAEVAPAPAKKGGARSQPKSTRSDRAASLLEWTKAELKGRAELDMASNVDLVYITKRLPTGLLSLDCALKGGFPAGAFSQVIGPKNSWKSGSYWAVIRQLQYLLGDKAHALLAMTEMRADKTQGRNSGVAVALSDTDIAAMERARVRNGWPPYTKEEKAAFKYQIGTIHEAHGYAVEDLFDIILRAVEMRVYHVIVIDSFGAIMSAAEAEAESMRDKTYGGAAGPNTQFLHKLTALLTMKTPEGETRDTCIIGVNQVRDDIKNPNKKWKSSGGNALEHAKFVDISFVSGKPLGKEKKYRTGSGLVEKFEQWGKEINWCIEKGKAGIHEGERGSFTYIFHTEADDGRKIPVNNVDFYMDTALTAMRLGIIPEPESGNWREIIGEDGGILTALVGGQEVEAKANGIPNLANLLYQDAMEKAAAGRTDSLMNEIRRLAFRKLDINIDYNWD